MVMVVTWLKSGSALMEQKNMNSTASKTTVVPHRSCYAENRASTDQSLERNNNLQ